MTPVPEVTITSVAYFPEKCFLENPAVRADGSILITAVLQQELWIVRATPSNSMVSPILVHRFEHPVTGIVEDEPDVFILSLTEGHTTHESQLARLDLTGWTPGDPASPEIIVTFDERARALNGNCLLRPGADCFAGVIWRVDLEKGARSATASVWLSHDTMETTPTARSRHCRSRAPTSATAPGPDTSYYTPTAQRVFMRVPVDPATLTSSGGPRVRGRDRQRRRLLR